MLDSASEKQSSFTAISSGSLWSALWVSLLQYHFHLHIWEKWLYNHNPRKETKVILSKIGDPDMQIKDEQQRIYTSLIVLSL
jgi:hypothetical protein